MQSLRGSPPRYNSELFQFFCDYSFVDDTLIVGWRSYIYNKRQQYNLRRLYVDQIGVYELQHFMETLVGQQLNAWHQIRLQNGSEMAEAMLPHWELAINRFLEGRENYVRERQHPYRRPDQVWFNDFAGGAPTEITKEAQRRARKLLREQLTDEQRDSFDANGAFHIKGKDKKTYKITNAISFNVHGPDGTKYCGQLRDVPVEDQMLAQKLLLENDPEAFFKNANRIEPQGQDSPWRNIVAGSRAHHFVDDLGP